MSDTYTEEDRERERNSWQYKAVKATRGNTSLLGCIVLMVIGRNAKNPPWIESGFTIYPDGVCYADLVDRHRMETKNAPICHVQDLKDNFNRLADLLKLSDDDRRAMFAELRKSIAKDLRLEHDILKQVH